MKYYLTFLDDPASEMQQPEALKKGSMSAANLP